MRLLDPQEIGKHEPEDVLKVYFEAESLLLQDNPEWDLPRVVESAMKATLHRLGAMNQYDLVLLKRAREDVLQLGLYPDVEKTLDDLCSQGITVVSLSVPDASSFVLPLLPGLFIFDSFSQDSRVLLKTSLDLFSTLFERLQSIRGNLKGKEQVLVITTGRFRVLELARNAGYPTILVQHNLESKVKLFPTRSPTLIIPGGLNELKEKIMTFSGDCATEDPGNHVYVMRAGPYHGVDVLGNGSFGR